MLPKMRYNGTQLNRIYYNNREMYNIFVDGVCRYHKHKSSCYTTVRVHTHTGSCYTTIAVGGQCGAPVSNGVCSKGHHDPSWQTGSGFCHYSESKTVLTCGQQEYATRLICGYS